MQFKALAVWASGAQRKRIFKGRQARNEGVQGGRASERCHGLAVAGPLFLDSGNSVDVPRTWPQGNTLRSALCKRLKNLIYSKMLFFR
jgi:hypothetical protein